MPNYFYSDSNGQKQGPIDDNQLRELVSRKIIVPETPLETESGHKGKAGQVRGLFAPSPSPFVQAASPVSSAFCTHCGNPVAEKAVACMSCGAKPTGHKNFCRSCGVAINPLQIVCVKCGAALNKSEQIGVTPNGDTSNSGVMWMHLTWPFVPLATLIIWSVIKDKHPTASIHGKNILNAFITTFIINIIFGVLIITFFGLAVSMETPNTPVGIISGLLIFFVFYLAVIRPIVSAIVNGIVAGKGEVRPYKWATRFFKT